MTSGSPRRDLLNILQIVRSPFQKKGFLILEMPFADDEIGALCYKGDGLGYVVINTSLPSNDLVCKIMESNGINIVF